KMHEKSGGSIIIISHQERILDIADKIIVLANGEVTEVGDKKNILPGILQNGPGCSFLKEKC
ncbi:MAG: ABC transporter ATP-binding protein, partial [Lachnospiraceae bacterium]|nr:ABC transporter ATP-binding protein [Lachnospiraceae bacterium]